MVESKTGAEFQFPEAAMSYPLLEPSDPFAVMLVQVYSAALDCGLWQITSAEARMRDLFFM